MWEGNVHCDCTEQAPERQAPERMKASVVRSHLTSARARMRSRRTPPPSCVPLSSPPLLLLPLLHSRSSSSVRSWLQRCTSASVATCTRESFRLDPKRCGREIIASNGTAAVSRTHLARVEPPDVCLARLQRAAHREGADGHAGGGGGGGRRSRAPAACRKQLLGLQAHGTVAP